MSHGINRTDCKTKNAQASKMERNRSLNARFMAENRPCGTIEENFLRPAYGKIGERRLSDSGKEKQD